jgi:hypothetical protein
VAIDIFTNGHDELLKVAENATAYRFLGQVVEETFNHVQPGGGGRCEVDVKPLVPPARNVPSSEEGWMAAF